MIKKVSPPSSWMDLRVGDVARTHVRFSNTDMEAFASLSGDRSPIHFDTSHAQIAGFKAPIVYGALMTTALSRMVGMELPGKIGFLLGWNIDFLHPLYVNEDAFLEANISQLSEVTRTMKLGFFIRTDTTNIAKGTALTKIVV